MSYAIAHLIYGLPITEKLAEKAQELGVYLGEGEDDDDEFGKGAGFEMLYTGCDVDAGFLGKELLEFDVCVDFHRFSQLEKAKADFPHKDKIEVEKRVQQFVADFPELAKILVDEDAKIDYYIVWSYS